MKISTLSIVIGNRACNARCGFCVSRMTGFDEVRGKRLERGLPVLAVPGPTETDPLPNFENAVALAKIAGTTTILLTGKGEPTLAPNEITRALTALYGLGFPFVELQTNALVVGRALRDQDEAWIARLRSWRKRGLNTMAISVVSTDDVENAEVYHRDYPPLATTVRRLHELGFTVRLSLMLVGGVVDSPERLASAVAWCREHHVEQLTVRPIRKPEATHDGEVSEFVSTRGLSPEDERAVMQWVQAKGVRILHLSHGAVVYDVDGQNVCLTDCLTVPEAPDHIRTLIYYSNGLLKYHWQYAGAVLLGAVPGVPDHG